jgi:hypothetical protein
MESKKSITKYIVLESIISIALGAVFMIIIWNKDDFWGKTIEDGIIRFFGGVSLIFFFSVFSVGIIGAIKLKRTDKILKAVFYSVCFWALSLIITAVVANFLLMGSVLIILAGIVYGFNLGIRYNSSEISN